MKRVAMVGAIALVASSFALTGFAGQQEPAWKVHAGHVGEGWRDTPDNMGLLPTAVAEAEIAAQHLALAGRSDGLQRVKAHVGHALNALDPSVVESGPGKGYGVAKAAQGAARHTELAGGSDDIPDGAKRHVPHVANSLGNVVDWTQQAIEIGEEILATDDPAAAEEGLEKMQATVAAILEGMDANGDGRIGPVEGEGGLAQATQHLGLMVSS